MAYERAYLTSEVAERLNCAQSTIRKYSIALEKQGFTFSKTQKGARLFSESDVATLARMKELSVEEKMPVDRIAERMLSTPAEVRDEMRSVEANGSTEILAELSALRQENAEIREALIHTNKQLAAVLVELKESQKMIAASVATEEEAEKEAELPPPKKWYEFWK